MKSYKLRFSKPVSLTGDWNYSDAEFRALTLTEKERLLKSTKVWNYGDAELQAAEHRAIKTRREAIRRKLRRKISIEERERLTAEMQDLLSAETQLFGVRHRITKLPLGKEGKPCVPKTARGKRHVPMAALPLDGKGRRYVPSARQIVVSAMFHKHLEKGNLRMALAKLAQIMPECGAEIRKQAETDPKLRRAINRVGSDVKVEWPPKPDELLILENFYATKILRRPLRGLVDVDAVSMLAETADRYILRSPHDVRIVLSRDMNVARYRRILRKFRLT